MMDLSFRHKLSEATTEDEFKSILKEQSSVYKRNIRQSESSAPKQSHDAMISVRWQFHDDLNFDSESCNVFLELLI